MLPSTVGGQRRRDAQGSTGLGGAREADEVAEVGHGEHVAAPLLGGRASQVPGDEARGAVALAPAEQDLAVAHDGDEVAQGPEGRHAARLAGVAIPDRDGVGADAAAREEAGVGRGELVGLAVAAVALGEGCFDRLSGAQIEDDARLLARGDQPPLVGGDHEVAKRRPGLRPGGAPGVPRAVLRGSADQRAAERGGPGLSARSDGHRGGALAEAGDPLARAIVGGPAPQVAGRVLGEDDVAARGRGDAQELGLGADERGVREAAGQRGEGQGAHLGGVGGRDRGELREGVDDARGVAP
ncbi:hypothetical protein [Nannocystis pusilla]|uniref:hypothetical protein n=1 Tax=Nannocystis pusilla TaxID=889268 RepID=UPI003DA2C0DB